MNLANGYGYVLLIAGALVTAVRIVVVFSGTTIGFWTSGGWELATVVLMVVALVHALATGFAHGPRELGPGGQLLRALAYERTERG
jgi:hypothetical protein